MTIIGIERGTLIGGTTPARPRPNPIVVSGATSSPNADSGSTLAAPTKIQDISNWKRMTKHIKIKFRHNAPNGKPVFVTAEGHNDGNGWITDNVSCDGHDATKFPQIKGIAALWMARETSIAGESDIHKREIE